MSIIRSVGDTVSQRGMLPANERIRTSHDLKTSFYRCFSVKYPGAFFDRPSKHPTVLGPIHAYFGEQGDRDPAIQVVIIDSLFNLRHPIRFFDQRKK